MVVNSWKRGTLILLFCLAFIVSKGQPPCGTPPCGNGGGGGPGGNACNGPNPPPTCPPNPVPIGGLEYLIIAGVSLGIYRYKKSRI